MSTIPHDSVDLYLAPVALAINARIAELESLNADALAKRIALEGDRPDYNRHMRQTGVIETVRRFIDVHGWDISWDERGIRMAHGDRELTLGIGGRLSSYVEGTGPGSVVKAESPETSAAVRR